MALHKAINFVKRIGYDDKLRSACYSIPSKDLLLTELGFDEVEFEDAINMQLVKCQTYEEADYFQQIKLWFTLL